MLHELVGKLLDAAGNPATRCAQLVRRNGFLAVVVRRPSAP